VKVRVRLFAVARELAGTESLVVDVPDPATVAQLRRALADAMPALGPVVPHVLFAVGSQYVSDQHVLSTGVEVACIPPVSGG
jgi:molybdopterin converting factor subunit 1